MAETAEVKINVESEVWRKVKSDAALAGKNVADYAGELLKQSVGVGVQ